MRRILTWLVMTALFFALSGCPQVAGPTTYSVCYNGNGNTAGSVPVDSVKYLAGTGVTVADNTGDLVRAGYHFAGWNTKADGTGTAQVAGSTFTMGLTSVTLYAAWSAVSVNANLRSLEIAGYSLDAPFDPAIVEYTVLVPAGTTTISLSATADDPRASLVINNPAPSAIPLAIGPNIVTATVTAENSSIVKAYKVTVYRCNTAAQVLDSVNGSLLPTAGISFSVFDGGTLVNRFKAVANPQCIYIAPGKPYRVVAMVAGRASDARESVRVTEGADNRLSFYCQKSGMSTFPAEAPTVDALEFTRGADPAAETAIWLDIASGSELNLVGVTAIRVKVSGTSEIEPTSWSGDGITLGIDYTPSFFMSVLASRTTSSYDAVSFRFCATALFPCAGLSITTGPHRLVIVVYDRANNRLEKTWDITVTSAPAPGADLSGAFFQSPTITFTTYGLSREYFGTRKGIDSLPVTSSGGTSYRATITFKLMTAATGGSAVPILGFSVKRSTDGFVYTTAGTLNYGALSTGVSGTHTYYDTDPDLVAGKTYKYIVTAFTDGSHSRDSAIMTGSILPPFTASLYSPAHESTIDATVTPPEFVFTISDSSLWDPGVAPWYYFAPIIRRKDGGIAFYGEFQYSLSSDVLYFREGNTFVNMLARFGKTTSDFLVFSGGSITLKPALFCADSNWYGGTPIAYMPGVTYEWDIFGNYTGAGNLGSSAGMNPMYFYKSGTNSIARSYADTYQNGNETLNGWFGFTVQ